MPGVITNNFLKAQKIYKVDKFKKTKCALQIIFISKEIGEILMLIRYTDY